MKICTLIAMTLMCCLVHIPRAIAQDALKPEDLYQKVLPSTMTLTVEKRDGSVSQGSAFMAVKEGMAVTAWHVVNNARRVTAKFSSGEEFESSGLVDKDEKRDVALIRVKVFGRPPLPLASSDPAVGTKAYAIGAPKGLDFSLSDGLVSQVRTLDGYKQYQFTCDVSAGNSGGPVLSAKGDVIGVVSWRLRDAQNLNFAVPAFYALALDATLPTQPWDTVRGTTEQALIAAAPSVGTTITPATLTLAADDFDRLLAEGMISTLELETVRIVVLQHVIIKRFGFEDGMPFAFYGMFKNAKARRDELANVIPPDPTRGRQKQFVLSNLEKNVEAADLLEQAVKTVQLNRGHTPATNEIVKKSFALGNSETKPLSPEDRDALKKSKALMDTLPKDAKDSLGFSEQQADFRLGVVVYPRNSLMLALVYKDSLAQKIGLKDTDIIVSAGTVTFTALEDFKFYLRDNIGKKVKIRLIRNGKEQDIELKIPADLPRRTAG